MAKPVAPARTHAPIDSGVTPPTGHRFWGGTMDFACVRALDEGYPVTNGPTWTLDGRTVFVNDTARDRIYAFDFDPDRGTLSNRRLWGRFGPGQGYPTA